MFSKIRKPKLGRAWDSRMTEEVVGGNPGLRGVPAFDPTQDVDLVDALNEQLEEGERVLAAEREKVAQALADTAQQRKEIEAKTADLLAAAPLLPDARAAAAARTDAEAAAAQLPKAQEAASTVADAQRLAAQLAFVPTAVKGLRVQPPVAGETGGQLFEFTPDASAITPATIQPGEAGGMLYDLTGATA